MCIRDSHSGLRAAAKIASRLGHAQEAGRWNDSADRLRTQFSEQAYDRERGRIIPMAGAPGQTFTDPEFPKAESRNGPLRDDRVDAGMLIIGRLEAFGRGQGVIPVDDRNPPDAGGGEVQEGGAAQAPGPDDEHRGRLEPFLGGRPEAWQRQVALVSGDLVWA